MADKTGKKTDIAAAAVTPQEDDKFDFFIFGSSSAILQAVVAKHADYFKAHVGKWHLIQRSEEAPAEFKDFANVTVDVADCSDAAAFEVKLAEIVKKYSTNDVPMHVFPTYGVFNQDYTGPNGPRFAWRRDSLQINLNSRLQILEAFRAFSSNTRFHLFGSLFKDVPQQGDYAMSMWYMNHVVMDPQNHLYNTLDVVLHNLGGMKTKFWWNEHIPTEGNPFLHAEIPTDDILTHGFSQRTKGIHTSYPTEKAKEGMGKPSS